MRLSLLLCLLLPVVCCHAQKAGTGALVLYQVTDQNGLSDNHVRCVLKDSRGFVWIGTTDGLNVMDGSQVSVFRHAGGDSATLSNDNITCLAGDKQGCVWIGTANGLNVWHPERHTFSSYIPPAGSYGISSTIRCMAVDRQQRVWCGTDGGLFLFDPVQHRFRLFLNTLPGHRWANSIRYLLFDSHDRLWVCTADGLWRFDIASQQFTKVITVGNGPAGDELCLCVTEDHKGAIWAGYWEKGLKEIDPVTGKANTYSFMHDQTVASIIETRQPDGSYLLWLDGPLLTFRPDTKQFFQYPLPFQLTTYPTVTPRCRSNDGWVWMGSDNGLYIYNPQRQLFHHRFTSRLASQGIAFMEWRHRLLIGGQGRDFLRVSDSSGKEENGYGKLLEAFPAGALQRSASLLDFQPEDDSRAWIGTSNGLLHLDLITGKNSWYVHKNGDSTSLPRNFIQHVFIDSHHRLWVFPWREGVWQMDSATGRFRRLWEGFITEAGKKKKLVIADAVEDSSGNLWLADLDEGIIFYERASGRFSKPFAHSISERYSALRLYYRNGYCYAMAEGLIKWKPGTSYFRQVHLPPGMDKEVTDLAPDAAGRWWWTTRNGLVVYDEATGNFQRFTIADGLVSNDMNGNLYCQANGTLLFATPDYITSFNPDALLHSARTAPVAVLREIAVNGRPLPFDGSQSLRLDHLSSNLLFRWTITDYSNPFGNRFYCRLQGIDSAWHYVGNKGEMQYANLSPGSYELLLKGVTANGVAAKNILPVHFIITPPFWQTWWFRALLLLLLGGIVYMVFRLRIRSIRKEEAVKSAFDNQKTELEMKALRAQMNPHFVFNSLSSIQESIVTGKTEAASRYLSKFSRLIRLILENSGKKFIPLKTEIESLTLYLELESFRFEDFTYIISIDPALDADSLHIPSMVIQPFVENALKHGFAHRTGDKQLLVHIGCENGQLAAIVEDNGIGRGQAELLKAGRPAGHQSLGMKITEDRLQLLRLQEDKKPSIFITDLVDEKGNAAGTRVKILLPTEE